MHPCNSFVISFGVPTHPVLDLLVACPKLSRRDEVQLLIREPVVRHQQPIDIVAGTGPDSNGEPNLIWYYVPGIHTQNVKLLLRRGTLRQVADPIFRDGIGFRNF